MSEFRLETLGLEWNVGPRTIKANQRGEYLSLTVQGEGAFQYCRAVLTREEEEQLWQFLNDRRNAGYPLDGNL